MWWVVMLLALFVIYSLMDGLGDLVSINQSTFVPGGWISDNMMLTQELMGNYHRRSGPSRCAFKVDIQKAGHPNFVQVNMHALNEFKNVSASIIHDLEQRMRDFLWCQEEMKKDKAKVAWESRYALVRDIVRSSFTLTDSVSDLITNVYWRWPPDWRHGFLNLVSISVPSLHDDLDDVRIGIMFSGFLIVFFGITRKNETEILVYHFSSSLDGGDVIGLDKELLNDGCNEGIIGLVMGKQFTHEAADGWTWVIRGNNKQSEKRIDNPYGKNLEKTASTFYITNFPDCIDARAVARYQRSNARHVASKGVAEVRNNTRIQEVKYDNHSVKHSPHVNSSRSYASDMNEGFINLKVHHIGGLWTWIQFENAEACMEFKANATLRQFDVHISELATWNIKIEDDHETKNENKMRDNKERQNMDDFVDLNVHEEVEIGIDEEVESVKNISQQKDGVKVENSRDDLCMRTRNSYFPNNSSVTIPRHRNKRRTPNVVEPELRTIVEVAPMAERTMEELLQAPTKGELVQIDTFYNGLNDNDQDSLNAATGKNLLSNTTREALNIIGNKSKVRYSRNRPNVSRMNTNFRENTSKTDDRIDKLADQISTLVDIFAKKVITPASVKAVEESCNQSSTLGTLSSNTISNPKGEMKAITTRSGVAYEGPSIPTNPSPKKVVERETEEITDKEQTNFQESTTHIQPPLREKAMNEMEKFFQIFQDLHFDISFADALLLMPKFASTIKSLLKNKDKLFELSKIPLNENCSAMLLKKLPEKLGDPDKFLIPCDFPRMNTTRYSFTYGDMSVNRIDIIDVAREEYAQEILSFSLGGNPTSTSEPILSDSSPSLTPFEGSDFILEEIEAYLKDESISPEIDHVDFDPEGDICLIEKLLNNDPFQLPPMDIKQGEVVKAKS
nr:reverse transcriptase domain-containing protein [Tanacetum cinerariifolium]